jgi:hypothetical protein
MPGTRITCVDIDNPAETETQEILNDFVVITDGTCSVTHVQAFANGTAQITIKRNPPIVDALRRELLATDNRAQAVVSEETP